MENKTKDLLALMEEMGIEKPEKPIPFSEIDDGFQVYQGYVLVLYGSFEEISHQETTQRYNDLTELGIKVDYIFYESIDPSLEFPPKVKPITSEQLYLLCQKEKVLVQFTSIYQQEEKIIAHLMKQGVSKVITFLNCYFACHYSKEWNQRKNFCPPYQGEEISPFAFASPRELLEDCNTQEYETFLEEFQDHTFHAIMMPAKTGDHTIIHNLRPVTTAPIWFGRHRPKRFHLESTRNSGKTVKMYVGIRDPLSLHLSLLYQHLSYMGNDEASWLFLHEAQRTPVLKGGGDVQALFDSFFELAHQENYIDSFMKSFQHAVLDLRAYPFDQEKGYTIIKDGNLEIFCFQLEKLNGLVDVFSDFVEGAPLTSFTTYNTGSEKWTGDSYQRARKEIKISQNLLDYVYHDPWIQHFYTAKDIENMKSK